MKKKKRKKRSPNRECIGAGNGPYIPEDHPGRKKLYHGYGDSYYLCRDCAKEMTEQPDFMDNDPGGGIV